MHSLAILSLLPLTHAHQQMLFTSSVSYCAPPSAILIQQFDISYVASNDSVVFNVSAASVEPNLTVSANVGLNVYGIRPINLTVDFCKVLSNVLCPLPQYNFSGSGSISLPTSLDLSSHVPGIAYKVPDLEGFAQATLFDIHTGQVKACVQTTLSNGWSTRQPAVSWTTGGIALVSLLYSIIFWFLHSSSLNNVIAPFLDLIYLYQHIAFTGLLNLNYPLTYISFSLNFAWSLGLFADSTRIQNAIDSLRNDTGGHVDGAVSPIGSTNRALSPYNVKRDTSLGTLAFDEAQVTSPATVTSASDALPAGIATYTNFLNISQENAFLSVFLTLLILLAIAIGLVLTLHCTVWLLKRWNIGKQLHRRRISTNIVLVLVLVSFSPAVMFACYQWTLKDSWLAILLSVITFLGFLAVIIFVAIRIYHLPSETTGLEYEPMIGQFKASRQWWYSPLLALSLVKVLVIGFGQKNGTVQAALLFTAELAYLLALISYRPFALRRSRAFAFIFSGIRIASCSLLIPFITSLGVKPITRVVIALVSAVVFSIGVVVAIVVVAITIIPPSLLPRRHHTSKTKVQQISPCGECLDKSSAPHSTLIK